MLMTEDLKRILKLYPRGYHSVSNEQMNDIMDAYDHQMDSPGSVVARFGVSRETLRMWGKKKIIHYFVRRDKFFQILEAYIPLYTFIDAELPNAERYRDGVDGIKQYLEEREKKRMKEYVEYYQKQLAAAEEGGSKKKKGR
jgi:hypothetical protein